MIPLRWTWTDLGRAIKAARWAFHHADDLAILEENLASDMPAFPFDHSQHVRIRKGLGQLRLGTFPLERLPKAKEPT